MKTLQKVGVVVFLSILLLSGCKTGENAESLQTTEMVLSDTPTAETVLIPSSTSTAEPPTATATITQTPTEAITATPTLDFQGITLFNFDFVYTQTSIFEFDLHYFTGEYYGTGRLQDGSILNYNCWFREEGSSQLACTSGAVPFDSKIFFQLFQKDTDELLYSNTFLYNVLTHGEVLYTPAGVKCVVEPVLSGLMFNEQTGTQCFIMTCTQNDIFLWGTLNTCVDPWPFQWDYYHPLHTPGT